MAAHSPTRPYTMPRGSWSVKDGEEFVVWLESKMKDKSRPQLFLQRNIRRYLSHSMGTIPKRKNSGWRFYLVLDTYSLKRLAKVIQPSKKSGTYNNQMLWWEQCNHVFFFLLECDAVNSNEGLTFNILSCNMFSGSQAAKLGGKWTISGPIEKSQHQSEPISADAASSSAARVYVILSSLQILGFNAFNKRQGSAVDLRALQFFNSSFIPVLATAGKGESEIMDVCKLRSCIAMKPMEFVWVSQPLWDQFGVELKQSSRRSFRLSGISNLEDFVSLQSPISLELDVSVMRDIRVDSICAFGEVSTTITSRTDAMRGEKIPTGSKADEVGKFLVGNDEKWLISEITCPICHREFSSGAAFTIHFNTFHECFSCKINQAGKVLKVQWSDHFFECEVDIYKGIPAKIFTYCRRSGILDSYPSKKTKMSTQTWIQSLYEGRRAADIRDDSILGKRKSIVLGSPEKSEEIMEPKYYHSRTGLPLKDSRAFNNDSDEDIDLMAVAMTDGLALYDFIDVKPDEKEFMLHWNVSMHRYNVCSCLLIPIFSRHFIIEHAEKLRDDSNFRKNLILHLYNLVEVEAVSYDDVCSLLMLLGSISKY